MFGKIIEDDVLYDYILDYFISIEGNNVVFCFKVVEVIVFLFF